MSEPIRVRELSDKPLEKSTVFSNETRFHKARIKLKVEILKKMRNDATTKAVEYMLKYEKLKKKDERLDLVNSFLTSGVIALSITSLSIPPVIFASIGMSSLGLILSSLHKTSKIKMKIERHSTTSKQWSELARTITNILVKNNMSSEQYGGIIEALNREINFIEDSSI